MVTKMKTSFCRIFLVLLSVAAACSAVPVERRNGPALMASTSSKIHKNLDATGRALSLRGGGVFGTPVTKDDLVTLNTIMCSSVGIIGMPAPEKAAQIFGFSLQEGSLGYVMYELFASTAVGNAILSYLTTKASISAPKIAMYGCLPCFYTTYRNVLKGTFAKNGFLDYFGTVQLAIFVACIYCIQTGSWDATLAAKVLSTFPLIMGLVGTLDPDLGGSLMGLPKQNGVTGTVCTWLYQALLVWGITSWSLLLGKSAYTAIGLGTLVTALGMVDSGFIRKANQEVGSLDASYYIYLAAAVAITAGLLLD